MSIMSTTEAAWRKCVGIPGDVWIVHTIYVGGVPGDFANTLSGLAD